ncbi:hypothetical protein BKA83DRAFT_679110 [Pisolithus microcarpus]|nr:hypothetical protein BKA83DRAFT_679110 [Pisolithus microcarpus]
MASPQFQESVWVAADGFHGDLDSALWYPQGAGTPSYDHYPEHLWKPWQDPSDNIHPCVDTSDNSFDYPPYYPLLLSLDSPPLPIEHSSQRGDSESTLGSIPVQLPLPLVSGLTISYRSPVPSPPNDTHCTVASIAGLPSSHCPPNAERRGRIASKKRSIEELDSYNVKEETGAHLSSLSTTSDPCCLPQLHLTGTSVKMSYASSRPSIQHRTSHPRERDAFPLRQEDAPTTRLHHSTDGLVRQGPGIRTLPTTNATWPNPDDPLSKSTKKGGEQKKQALACLFCRERKIACGRPSAHSPDQTCNQCARRRIKCEYPTELLTAMSAGQTSSQSLPRAIPIPPNTTSTPAPTTTNTPSSKVDSSA